MSQRNQTTKNTNENVLGDVSASSGGVSYPNKKSKASSSRFRAVPPHEAQALLERAGKCKFKKNKRKLRRAAKEVCFDDQSGSEGIAMVSKALSDICRVANINLQDSLLAEVEGVAALCVTLQGCSNYTSFASALFLFVRRYCSTSVTKQVMDYIDGMMLESQSGDEAVVSSTDWLDMMRNIRTNWTMVRECKFFTQLSKLLGLTVVLGLCKPAQLTFSVREYIIWEPELLQKHMSSLDIVDAAVNTVTYFVTTMSLCWRRRSLLPLFANGDEALKLDERFNKLILWWDLVKNGNLKRIADVEDVVFDTELEELTTHIRMILPSLKGIEKKLCDDKMRRLLQLRNDYITLKICSGVRRAPYCIELFGPSSQGKTTCGEQLVSALLTSAGLPTGNEYRASYNPGDKYMSNWKTNKVVMTVDDLANEKKDFVERPPTRAIIDICNNTPFYANMADLDSKGKVFVEPAIMMVTTNVKDLDAYSYSNCPYSIQRRMHAVITVRARPQFQIMLDGKPQGLDSAKVAAWQEENGVTPTFDDIWILSVEKAVEPDSLACTATYEPITWKGKSMENITFREAVQYVIEDFTRHRVAQDNIIERMTMRTGDIALCPHPGCRQIAGYCDAHDKEPVQCIPITDKDVKLLGAETRMPPRKAEGQRFPQASSRKSFATNPRLAKRSIELERIAATVDRGKDVKHSPLPQNKNQEDTRFEKQFGERIADAVGHASGIVKEKISKDVSHFSTATETLAVAGMMGAVKLFVRKWDWMSIIPSKWLGSSYFLGMSMYIDQTKVKSMYLRKTLCIWTPLAIFCSKVCLDLQHDPNFWGHLVLSFTTSILIGCALQATVLDSVRDEYKTQLTRRNKLLPLEWSYTRMAVQSRFLCKSILLWAGIFGVALSLYLYGYGTFLFSSGMAIVYGFGASAQAYLVRQTRNEYREKIRDRGHFVPMVERYREEHVSNLCKACAIVGALYTIAQVYRAWRKIQPQGSLAPSTVEEVEQRDAERNVWTPVVRRTLPVIDTGANTTPNQLEGLINKNLVYGSVAVQERTLCVNGLFLMSNLVVIPDHYFLEDEFTVVFRKVNPESCGGKFRAQISKKLSYHVPNTDIRLCYVSTGGSFKDLSKYTTDEELSHHEFVMLWRALDGSITRAQGTAHPEHTRNGSCSFRGYYYDSLTINTFAGLCGAALFSARRAILSGIHLGGHSGQPRGCAGMLKRCDIVAAREYLRKQDCVVFSGTAEKFETQILGKTVVTETEPHIKSPLRYMPDDSQVEYYGACPGASTFKTNVKVTPLSEHVTDVMDFPNKFGPPVVTPQYYGWQTCLENVANPAFPFRTDLLEIAVKDYKSGMIPIFQKEMWRVSRPLTEHENICGIPGKKFMDSIKLNTAIGFPLTGVKRNYVTETVNEDGSLERIFDKEIVDEINRCEECYRKGERAYTIAKACKKDEILAKKKCRIFYGNSIALTFLIRKYFLPLLRVMQMNPLVSECAVGVNSHGPEWEDLHQHVLKYGEDRIIGGDYGKYDQKLSSQLLFAALRILMDFARECDYSEEDLGVMEAMTGDIVFAVIAYNGDLIGLTEGTHISGNSLTVILNGICGSLNLRCYFYEKYNGTFEKRKVFRDWVSLMTYGDDNIGSVRKGVDFTIKGASEFLGRYGQTYTMPDKTSELLDFLPIDQFEFLKRKSIYHSALERHVGALIDESCFKMLHCFMRDKQSPLTEEHASAQNIDTALREWFNHGPEVYEHRRSQLTEVASRAGVKHLTTTLDRTYDDVVEDWKDNYDPTRVRKPKSLELHDFE